MSAVQPSCGAPAAAAPVLQSLPELALTAICEQLPPHWRCDLRATCKKLQQNVDAHFVRRVVVGEPGLVPSAGDDAVFIGPWLDP